MTSDDTFDPKPTADRMAAEIASSGSASQQCLTEAHAQSVVHELRAQGFSVDVSGKFVAAH